MAEAVGLQITPHISGGGLGYVYMLQMVSVCPAAAEYHEFKMFHTRDANGTVVPVESKAEPFQSVNGVISINYAMLIYSVCKSSSILTAFWTPVSLTVSML